MEELLTEDEATRHAQEIMEYMSENWDKGDDLRYRLRKNTTAEPDHEFIQDVFTDCLIQIYDWITQKRKRIDNPLQFCFVCLRWKYITMQNKRRKERDTREGLDKLDFDSYIDEAYDYTQEKREEKSRELLDDVIAKLEQNFNTTDVNLFLTYMRLKQDSQNKMSYAKLSKLTGLSIEEICKKKKTMERLLQQDEELTEKFKKL